MEVIAVKSNAALRYYIGFATIGAVVLVGGAACCIVAAGEQGTAQLVPMLAGVLLIVLGCVLALCYVGQTVTIWKLPSALIVFQNGELDLAGVRARVEEISALHFARKPVRWSLLNWGTLVFTVNGAEIAVPYVDNVMNAYRRLTELICGQNGKCGG